MSADYLDFFDHRAFTDDNPNEPCYCTSPNQDEKQTVKAVETKVEKKVSKAKAAKLEIIVQSPMGGNITAEEIAAKVPAGAESVFVRVDQNKLWWIKGEETGSVDIWE